MNDVMLNPLKKLHPQWYQATDYHWLDHEYTPRDTPDISLWNKRDDVHRRDMSSWSRDLEDFGELPLGEF